MSFYLDLMSEKACRSAYKSVCLRTSCLCALGDSEKDTDIEIKIKTSPQAKRHELSLHVITFCFSSFLFVSGHFFLFHIISLHYLLSSFLIISYNSFNTMSVYLSMFTTPITIANIISISIINCQNHNFALPPSDTTCNC